MTLDGSRIGMGCMRLSTVPERDETRGIEVIHAALEAGVNFLDTADAYCWDASETGHNERLIARALASWRSGAPETHTRTVAKICIATKGGLTRPNGRWTADGRARSLAAACEASLRALAVDQIDLYQLHAPDPRTSLSTSVRALDGLRRNGLVHAIGLCNVTVGQIEQAMRITAIASVQVELSIWHDANVLSGVVDYCSTHGIRLIAYRPLGGTERRRRILTDPVLGQLAAEYGATPFEIALAALTTLSDAVLPIPGATRVESAHSIGRSRRITLADADLGRLADRFPACRALRLRTLGAPSLRSPRLDGEVVLVMGLPGAGKSTLAETLVDEGYTRANRDQLGGSLLGLLPVLDRAIQSGESRIVLDNTYVSRKSRAAVIQVAGQRGLAVRCVWLSTSVEDAQINAVTRIVSRYGGLLGPEDLKAKSRGDVAAFGPMVQFRYQRELEPPDVAEGFSRVDNVKFARRPNPTFDNRAVIVWCDGVLYRSRSGRRTATAPEDTDVLAERGAVLRRYQEEGWKLLGMSWLPEIAEKKMSRGEANAVFARVRELLGVSIEIEYCPHGAGPPTCWCRKPLPGLGVVFVQRHRLNPAQCIYVGSGGQDPGFARRFGFQFRAADEFFEFTA